MEPFWFILALGLTTASLGLKGLINLIFAFIAFILGSLVIILGVSFSRTIFNKVSSIAEFSRQNWSWYRGPMVSTESVKKSLQEIIEKRMYWESTSLTGSNKIDDPLNMILSYVFRDYIYPWHFKVTHDRAFPTHLKDSINHLINNMSFKVLIFKQFFMRSKNERKKMSFLDAFLQVQDIDWMPFLTTRLVDDVASHVRLFKKARLALKNPENNENGGKSVDLETLFFDAEVAMETNLCRDLASSIQQEELHYLQNVAEILLFLLLKEEDFNAIPMRTLAREILVNVILKPTLDLVSDPDFINQTLVWLYEDYKIKHEVFLMSIRYSENMEELNATKEMVTKEISFIRSNDSKGDSDSSLKQQLNSLLYLTKVIENRIKRLNSGSDIDSLVVAMDQVDWNQEIGPGMKLFDLPIDVILKNNIALSYFIDYMTSIGCQSYLFFYLNIEGWKVSAESQLQGLYLKRLFYSV